jgi:uncharacterized membrane protein YeaQ/YmgE (transglycosylase-associated protein family)
MTNDTESIRPTSDHIAFARGAAKPAVAAAFAAGILYVWLEATFRLLFTYFPAFNANWVLWNGRVGDIAAMWLTISGVSIVAGIILYLIWRRSEGVGSLADWTIVLIGSSIAAPMLGEIGQSAGSVTTGAGSASATTVIAYVGGALLLRLHTRD